MPYSVKATTVGLISVLNRSFTCALLFSGDPLPLPSLRLLVPPLQLMMASMWQVLKKQDVMNYWKVAEYVSLVIDMVPELLMFKHRAQLNLGLRARVGTIVLMVI